ncbi:hypothetical protein, partial [Methylocaldum sp.]|uniref:hypothetical protein n=1 Tax=Methylocaldum sp. TaxID=1969727 RepID=UPI002D467484
QWQHIAQVVELGFTLLDSKQAFFDHLCLGFKNKAAIFSWQGFFEVPLSRALSYPTGQFNKPGRVEAGDGSAKRQHK